MIRAVVWKEVREQGLIAAALVVLGGGVLIAAAVLGDPPAPAAPADLARALGAGRLAALMLVVTAGMVCGGMLFAGEREAGTIGFLDALPASRWHLWRAKLVAGLVLAGGQIGLLLAVCAAAGVTDGPFARRLLVYAGLAFAWGALGSTLARTTLASVGIGIASASLATFVYLLPIYLVFGQRGGGALRPAGWVTFELLMALTPLVASARHFTAQDRARAADGLPAPAPGGADPVLAGPAPARGRPGLGLRAVAWLTLRQLRLPALVLSAFALAAGLVFLSPDARAVFVWPPLALTAGVIAGVTAFGPEQGQRTAGFWSDQRLPVGRAWWVKIGLHLGLVAWLLVLLVLPAALRAQFAQPARYGFGQGVLAAVFRSRLFDELGPQAWKFVFAPAAYGFAFGHLFSLLFRKPVVASGAAVMVGGVAAAVWLPSLLAGGLNHWQVWTPAAAVLLTGRALIRPWAADRVAARGPLVRLAWGCTAAGALLAAGIAYRVAEVRDEPGGEDDLAHVAALPGYDENQTGREFRAASERFARAAAVVGQPGGEPPPDGRRRVRVEERLDGVLVTGWPAADPDLRAALPGWLDAVHTDPAAGPDEKPWPLMAEEAAAPGRAAGVFDPPQLINSLAASAGAVENARRMGAALLVRGLQQQARGDPTVFVRNFRTVLALARTVRYGGGANQLLGALDLERAALTAADRWLERLGTSEPVLLRALGRAADGAGAGPPFDPRTAGLSDRYVIRELMKAPNQWLTGPLTPPGWQPEQIAPEVDLVAFAWAVPWEKERTRRLIGLGFESGAAPNRYPLLSGRPGAALLVNRYRAPAELADADRYLRTAHRALVLKCAILMYQADTGAHPDELVELVEGDYLKELPGDPYADGQPLLYERTKVKLTLRRPTGPGLGGGVVGPGGGQPPPPVEVAAGQGRVWSVGADGKSQNGEVVPGGPRAEDIVFIVPLPVHAPEPLPSWWGRQHPPRARRRSGRRPDARTHPTGELARTVTRRTAG